ncbi:zinc finger protein 184-like isoform X2 [Dendronephthya gigantea]|nr:zinc finger protein 184-like isoform X2 [Dendronephthya gigantea]XP_028403809.1 zinc finger protein 184-like isoform X2 [Dendronephthya gigantea]
MSCSEDETNVASVLSQMSQSTQPLENVNNSQHIDSSVIAHECDVETSLNQEMTTIGVDETLTAAPVAGLCIDNTEPKLQTAISDVVSSVKVYPCEYCGKVFNKSYNLKTHHRVHSGERPYQCTVCGHGFANLGDLKRHDRTHTGEKPYICEFCSKSFSDFGSHKRHLRLHTGYKPFKCDKCDREFTRLDSYKNHIRLHTGIRPYKCEECQKEFNYLTTYKRHQNIHSGERPYSCDQCGKKFTRLIYVKNHKQNNCGKQRGKKSQAKPDEGMLTSSDAAVVALGGDIKITDGSMIENISRDLSLQSGVQLNLTKVIYTNDVGLIESSTSHTLIVTANSDSGQQLLELTAGVDDKTAVSPVVHAGQSNAGTIFLAPSITTQHDELLQHDAVISMNPDEHAQNAPVVNVGVGEDNQISCKAIEVTVASEKQAETECSSDQNAMYIAIDPTQEVISND